LLIYCVYKDACRKVRPKLKLIIVIYIASSIIWRHHADVMH